MRGMALAAIVAACGGGDPAIGDAPCVCDAPTDAHAPAALALAPSAFDFGSVIVGCFGGPTTFQVTNTGSSSSTVLAPTLAGSKASTFAITDDLCTSNVLAPGESCPFAVETVPATSPVGARSAPLSVNGAEAELSVTILSANALMVSPFDVQFGAIAVGAVGSKPITVSMVHGCPTSKPLSLTLDGPDAEMFSTTLDTCSGRQLAGGESCSIAVEFAPSATGDRSAELTIYGGVLASALLSGTGDQ